MPLFTMLLEFEGGTYVSQRLAADFRVAFEDWKERMLHDEIADGASVGVAVAFQNESADDIVPLSGLVGVWYVTGTAEDNLPYLHIVQTDA